MEPGCFLSDAIELCVSRLLPDELAGLRSRYRDVLDELRLVIDASVIASWKSVVDLGDESKVLGLVEMHHLNRRFHTLRLADQVVAVREWAGRAFGPSDVPGSALLRSEAEVLGVHSLLARGVLARLGRVEDLASSAPEAPAAAGDELAALLGCSLRSGGEFRVLGRRLMDADWLDLDGGEQALCWAAVS